MSRRETIYQLMLLAVIAGAAWFIYSTTQANLARLGVDSGFDFLWRRAGFEIGQTLIRFNADSSIASAFLVALLNTLALATAAIIGASLLGLVVGATRLSRNWLASRLAITYTETFRNVPALIQIFFWYFVVLRSLPSSHDSLSFIGVIFLNNRGLFVPQPEYAARAVLAGLAAAIILIALLRFVARRREVAGDPFPVAVTSLALLLGLPTAALLFASGDWTIPVYGRFGYHGGIVFIPEFMALTVGLSMYNATYIGEIVRSGFSSVPADQLEAAQSLGLSKFQILRLVVFPQALRVMIPPLTTVYLNLFKATSLAAAVAYPEVVSVFVGTVNNLVGQPVTIMAMTLMVYVVVSLCIAVFLNFYHKRLAGIAHE